MQNMSLPCHFRVTVSLLLPTHQLQFKVLLIQLISYISSKRVEIISAESINLKTIITITKDALSLIKS